MKKIDSIFIPTSKGSGIHARDEARFLKMEEKFPSSISEIFIANIAEIAKFLTRSMAPTEKQTEIFEDHAYSDRFLFHDQDNRLLITPLPLDKEFVTDTCQLLGFKNFLHLSPQKVGESTCEAILADRQLLSQIIALIKANPAIKILAYAATSEFIKLVTYLRQQHLKFFTPELPLSESLWTTAFFGSKAGFRQALASFNHGFPSMPRGTVCSTQEEIIAWSKHYLRSKGGVVIKANRGLAGAGLHIFKKDTLPETLTRKIENILQKEPFLLEGPVVVEEFIPPNLKIGGGDPDVEVKVTESSAIPLYVCGMRVTPAGVFQGIEIGKAVLPDKITQVLNETGKRYGVLLHEFGYRGFFDIDFVSSLSGEVHPIEANLRRTGGTHAFELAKRLFGPDFSHKHYLISLLKAETPRFTDQNYLSVKNAIADLLYPMKGKKEGVILTVVNYLSKGKLGYAVVGKDKKRVYEIESTFLKRLQ